jgi:hypothetical protein
VGFALKKVEREPLVGAPNKVALIAKVLVKADERTVGAPADAHRSWFLAECHVPPPGMDRLGTQV